MPTPYKEIEKSFHSRFKSNVEIIPELEMQYFSNALGDFELHLFSVSYTTIEVPDEEGNIENITEITESLNRSQINLLGALMYKYYLSQQIDEVLQLQNIVGKDIALTGVGQTKQEYSRRYLVLQSEINELVGGLKKNTFED